MWRSVLGSTSLLPTIYRQTKWINLSNKVFLKPTTFKKPFINNYQNFNRNFHIGLPFPQTYTSLSPDSGTLETKIETESSGENASPSGVGVPNQKTIEDYTSQANDLLNEQKYDGILKIEKEMSQAGVTPTSNLLSLFILSNYKLMQIGRPSTDPERYYAYHEKHNIPKEMRTYQYYMLTCQLLGNHKPVKDCYYDMKKNNVVPTMIIINIVLSSAFVMKHTLWGKEIDRDIKAWNLPKSDAIKLKLGNLYCNQKSKEELNETFQQLKELMIPELYSTLLEVSILYNFDDGIEHVWKIAFLPDSTRFLDEGTALRMLESLARSAPTESKHLLASSIYHRLKNQKIYSPSCIIALFAIYMDNNRFTDAIKILCTLPPKMPHITSAMIAQRFLVTPTDTLSIKSWNRSGIDTSLSQVTKALKIVEKMFAEGYKISCFVLDVLMRACGLAGNLEYAYDVFVKIEALTGSISLDSFNYLLEACSFARHGNYALEVLEEMKRRNITPDTLSYYFLIETFTFPGASKKDAISAMEQALASSCHISLPIFDRIISFLVEKKDIDAAQHYINLAKSEYNHNPKPIEDYVPKLPIDKKKIQKEV